MSDEDQATTNEPFAGDDNAAVAGAGAIPPSPDEMAVLKMRANTLGIVFSNNIGIAALKAKIEAKMAEPMDAHDPAAPPILLNEEVLQVAGNPDKRPGLNPLTGDRLNEVPARERTFREQQIHEAMALVRCRITNLDPKKKDLHGEILTVGNRYIGTVKKFIPYGELTDDGYHIPKILFDELDSRRFLHIQVTKDRQTNQPVVKTSYAKEFAIEVLPMLTPAELAKLASAQLAANNA